MHFCVYIIMDVYMCKMCRSRWLDTLLIMHDK